MGVAGKSFPRKEWDIYNLHHLNDDNDDDDKTGDAMRHSHARVCCGDPPALLHLYDPVVSCPLVDKRWSCV